MAETLASAHTGTLPPVVVVDASAGALPADVAPGTLPVVIVGVTDSTSGDNASALSPYDLVVDPSDAALAAIVDAVERRPLASTALAVLLRHGANRSVDDGLASESAVYSTLQAGPEFAAWRRSETRSPAGPDPEPAVLVDRHGDELTITLNRPRRHNAFSASMRDGLVEAFDVALTDESIRSVQLRGAGRSFCSGGDLGEFGTFPDPASAHAIRLTRSPARLAHRLHDRLHAHLHGACLGAGIELPAFAGRVTATRDAVIGLPELSLGLIPGAGGTVSLPRRIGRQRTLYLALSGARLAAPVAHQWGLVDELVEEV